MCSFIIVVFQPFVQIGLQLIEATIELLAERDLVELLQDRLVEALADTVGRVLPRFCGHFKEAR